MGVLSRRAFLGLIVAGSALPWPLGPVRAQLPRFVRIGTGAIGGTYFPTGGLIANAISHPPGAMGCEFGGSCGVPGLVAAAVSTQGSVDNAVQVAAGKLDLALCQADVAYFAYQGTGAFAEQPPLDNLRVIANLFPEQLHVVVTKESGIDAIGKLRQKRINLGERHSGTLVAAELVLAAHRLRLRQLRASYENLDRAAALLIEDKLDGLFMMGGYPLRAITHAADSVPIALVPVSSATAERLITEHAFFSATQIPEGAYPGVETTDTLAVGAQLIVAAGMDEDLVYKITRALWDPRNRRVLDSGHPNGRLIQLATALTGIAIPLHPGATRYYQDIGLLETGG